jgi:hypothetical protein
MMEYIEDIHITRCANIMILEEDRGMWLVDQAQKI